MAKRKQRRSGPPKAPSYGEQAPMPPAPVADADADVEAEAEAAPDRNAAMKRGYARAEERNQLIRDGLEPLAPGERPGAVTAAAIVALVLAGLNLAATLAGGSVGGDEATPVSFIFTAILVVAAIGMWQAKYWAVLGFQALLTLQLVICFLLFLSAATALDVGPTLLLAALIGGGGFLFWKLIRAMARLQMPVR